MSHTQAPVGGYAQSPDPTMSDAQWLQQLSSHPIFTSRHDPNGASASAKVEMTFTGHGSHTRLMAIRGTDLIVVVHNEVRIASLVDAKASASNQPLSPSPSSCFKTHSSASYKVLVPAQDAAIDFDIRHLSINPTGKLLACVGESQITLMVMPRSGYSKHVDRQIVCRTVPVGPYYHSIHSDVAVSKVDWHPWSEAGTSLLVLTEDGLLREYDVAKDTQEPQQMASFLPLAAATASHRSRSRSTTPGFDTVKTCITQTFRGFGVSAEDDDATTAVSFSLCVTDASLPRATSFDQDKDQAWAAAASRTKAPSDWSPLTVFGLMKNGDIWALCPFLPKSAFVPAAYIHNLAKLASYRANAIECQQTWNVDTQLRYVNALLKQASQSSFKQAGGSRRQSTVTQGADRFSRSRSTSTMDVDELVDNIAEGAGEGSEKVHDGPVRLHPPSWSYRQDIRHGGSAKKAPRPQGPFLLKPAPVELCDERESAACDLVWTWLTNESNDAMHDAAVTGVGSLSIVGHDGRVDVGLVFKSVEAAWDDQTSKLGRVPRRQSKPSKTNRYGLSDTEDERDEFEALTLDEAEELPCLLIYETIDLGLLDTALENGSASRSAASDLLLAKMTSNKPSFVRDPLYGDTMYVYHAFGAQCLGFATWAGKLLEALNMPSQDELDNDAGDNTSMDDRVSRETALVKMLHHGHNTEVVWVVNTVAGEGEKKIEINGVTAVSILSDVYLSYAFLAVTADLQLVGVELSLRVDQDDLNSLEARGGSMTFDEANSASGGPKLYVSLLGQGAAFQPPSIFSQSTGIQGLPSHPRRAAALSGTTTRSELEITPELLRAFGKTIETYRHEIRDVVSAGNAVQARLELQLREMTRQLEKLNTIRQRCLEFGSKGALGERVQNLAKKQVELVLRVDKALQRLMDSHQPSLSMYEKRWFEELQRIANEVGVTFTEEGQLKVDARSKRKSLVVKAELISHQLSLLRPQMEAMRKEGKVGKQTGGKEGEREGMLGEEQLVRVEKLLSGQAIMLSEAKEKVQQLNKRMMVQIKEIRDTPSVSGDGDFSVLFTERTDSRGFGTGLPISSTAFNLKDVSFSSSRRQEGYPRTGSSFFG
ncbi:uncharacterized protein MEPE_00353 [Melanopsichium pennsylvanicum]|uniref:Uncharacterized protein n=2 Tax=Melanopsichium pennsylvanicum TaxID=63383 RepID=A0AAJ4XGE2_9BASI|nr:nuclear pore complex protein [Melanopsichium pennsylvanicum 4]SNX81648.1 uncharacterized protein MEPE_00353 [Melanopsichium pennsylvanicum]